MARYGCPKCGSQRVREWNTVWVAYDVERWTEDGTPEDYSGEGDPEWDTAEPVKNEEGPYQCSECLASFDEPARIGGAS